MLSINQLNWLGGRDALADEGVVERAPIEGAFDRNRLEVVGHNKLRECWIAADMPLGLRMQHLGIEHPDDVAQIEIAIGNRSDVFAANLTEIAFVTFSHGR